MKISDFKWALMLKSKNFSLIISMDLNINYGSYAWLQFKHWPKLNYEQPPCIDCLFTRSVRPCCLKIDGWCRVKMAHWGAMCDVLMRLCASHLLLFCLQYNSSLIRLLTYGHTAAALSSLNTMSRFVRQLWIEIRWFYLANGFALFTIALC